jgi:hypothetical protein
MWGMLATIQFRVLASHFLSKNLKIKIYKTTVLTVVLYGVKLGPSQGKNID